MGRKSEDYTKTGTERKRGQKHIIFVCDFAIKNQKRNGFAVNLI